LKYDEETIEQKAERRGVPIISPENPRPWKKNLTNPVVAICGKCGLEIRSVMMYSCPYSNCPVFVKGIYDGTKISDDS